MSQLRPLLTVSEVAPLLRLSKAVTRDRAKSGDLPAIRISPRGTWRFRRADIEALIAPESPHAPAPLAAVEAESAPGALASVSSCGAPGDEEDD
jgi:excisionase family DNA binding protein